MRNQFVELYTRVCIDAKTEQLEKRWQGIQEYCNLDEADIYNLVKMSYSLNAEDTFKDEFVNLFQNIDISFQSRYVEEQKLLASVCLMDLMKNSKFNLHIAILVVCVSKYCNDALVPELEELAYKILGEASSSIREESLEFKSCSVINENKLIDSLKNPNLLEVENIASLSSAFSEIIGNVNTITKNQNKMIKKLGTLQEDSDILSWITGSWSNELNRLLSKKDLAKDVALILAKELVDFIEVIPGPYAFEAFLKKMLDNCKCETKTYSLVTMIDSIDDMHKSSILNYYKMDSGKHENTPILCSIKCAYDAKQPDVWKSTAQNKLSIDIAEVKFGALEWAKLLYFECLLVKLEGCE